MGREELSLHLLTRSRAFQRAVASFGGQNARELGKRSLASSHIGQLCPQLSQSPPPNC